MLRWPSRPAASLPRAPFLERVGVGYFRRRHRLEMGRHDARAAAEDAVHVLNPDERRGLRTIERLAIGRAAAAGGASALISASAEIRGPTTFFVAVTVVTSAAELAFLYWDALRSVHALARVAGLPLFPAGAGPQRDAVVPSGVAPALARAALELPNPPEGLLGINPRRSASKLALAAASILYKLKIGLTSFLLRALLARLLGAAMRSYLPLVSVPVTAGWNALVAWLILREARVRAMGPSAAAELLGAILRDATLSRAGAAVAVRAVGCAVVSKRDMHPNLAVALELVHRMTGTPEIDEPDDEGRFLDELAAVDAADRRTILRLLKVGLVLDGRVTRRDRSLLRRAQRVCGGPEDDRALDELRRAFVDGVSIVNAV
jgi:hypothetical protein